MNPPIKIPCVCPDHDEPCPHPAKFIIERKQNGSDESLYYTVCDYCTLFGDYYIVTLDYSIQNDL